MPPGGSDAIARPIVAGRPIASNTNSAPPSPAAARMPSIVAAGSAGVGPHGVRRAERAGEVELRRVDVHRHDPPRAREDPAHDAREADPAEPDHGDRGPGGHLRRPDDGPDAGRDAAADERRDLGRHPSGIGTAALAGTTCAVAMVPIER